MPTAAPPTIRTEVLASRENRWLRRFHAALKDYDAKSGQALGIEGPRLVEEALLAKLTVEALLVSESGARHLKTLAPLLPASARLLRTRDRLFAEISGTESPQGVAALVRPREWHFEDLLSGADSLVVVLVGVQDPGNVGTILRTAEAFGASGAIATRGTAHPWGPKALRASAGSSLRIPLLAGLAPAVTLTQLKVASLKLIAASSREGELPARTDFRAAVGILIGNEGAGLPEEVERSADMRVRIPLAAGVESLNASAAAAVLLYEASRQRRQEV